MIRFILIGSMVFIICSCRNQKQETTQNTVRNTETKVIQELVLEKNEFSFADLKNFEFYFSSGAGAWRTVLMIHENGNFSGEYLDHDTEAGENYKGVAYQCKFHGQFTQPVKVNEFTYSVQIAQIEYEKEAGTEEIKDEMLYRYTDAYGLENTQNILIYLPGTPYTELSKEVQMWVQGSWMNEGEEKDRKLPFYVLNNEVSQFGFSSYHVIDELKKIITYNETSAASLEESITNDILTQLEYNEKTKELYDLWDSLLNRVWEVLKQTQDTETMKILTAEQLKWIALKEQEIAKAGAEYEGGSIQPMVMNQKAAEVTKVRVYELMKIFD